MSYLSLSLLTKIMFIVNPEFLATVPTEATTPGGSSSSGEFSLEAGENLTIGDPLKVTANKFYKADAATDSRIIGLAKATYTSAALATAVFSGELASLSGLTPWAPYYMNTGGGISAVPPSTGYLMQIGTAISATSLLVIIEDSILLS